MRAVEAVEALAARGDRADDDPLANRVVLLEAFAELLDDADRLMTEDESRANGYSPLNDMHVRAADRRRADANHGLTGLRPGLWYFFDADVVDSVEDDGFHSVHNASFSQGPRG